jgi:GNAT superfamily N-acetyltransferase
MSAQPSRLGALAAFRAAFARRQAAELLEVPGGVVVRDHDFALSHEHNQLLVDRAIDPTALPELAERRLGDLRYRHISVLDEALGAACTPVLLAAGYQRDTELLMARSTSGVALPTAPAREVEPADFRDALLGQLRTWMPGPAQAELHAQLADRRTARRRGTPDVRFLACYTGQGEVAAWADLYLDPGAELAQLEDLVTADAHTRQGHGDTLLTTALAQAAAAGCGELFLLADAADWPQEWYARRGFEVLGRSYAFVLR